MKTRLASFLTAVVALTASVPALADSGSQPAVGKCKGEDRPYNKVNETILDAFATFDDATTPPPAGNAEDVLADWLAFLSPNVVFESANDPARIGRAAVAGYFAPLLPMLGAVEHDLQSISPLCGVRNAWVVRGKLHLTRKSDGVELPVIPFTDTLFFNGSGDQMTRYEIRMDPAPIGLLFAP